MDSNTIETLPTVFVSNDSNERPSCQPESSTIVNSSATGFEFDLDCSVCLNECVFPVQLPCRHVFCFLCAKGAFNKQKRCPICRGTVPEDYFEHPNLVTKPEQVDAPLFDQQYSWFYSGENGWWLYDEEHSREIESAFKRGIKQLDLMIADQIYTIDLEQMVQYRKRDRRRQRKIRRTVPTPSLMTKGIAGIKCKLANPTAVVTPTTTDVTKCDETQDEMPDLITF